MTNLNGDLPDAWTFVGVGILIVCAIYISYRERVKKMVHPCQTNDIAL